MSVLGDPPCAAGGCATSAVMRTPTDHIYYGFTKGICTTCLGPVDVKIVLRGADIWHDKFCPRHGHEKLRIADAQWYLDAVSFVSPATPPTAPPGTTLTVRGGCPYDCGPCALHQQRAEVIVDAHTGAWADTPQVSIVELEADGAEVALRDAMASPRHRACELRVRPPASLTDAYAGLSAFGLSPESFVPSPFAHPLCLGVAYVLREGGQILAPLAELLGRGAYFEVLAQDFLLTASAGLRDALLASGDARIEPILPALRADGWRDALDGALFGVFAHGLMDAATFDVGRVVRCPMSVQAPTADSAMAQHPLCAHETLYTDEASLAVVAQRRVPSADASPSPSPLSNAAPSSRPGLPIFQTHPEKS